MMKPKTIHEAKRLYTDHRESFMMAGGGEQCHLLRQGFTECPGVYPDFASYADSLDFTVEDEKSEFPVESEKVGISGPNPILTTTDEHESMLKYLEDNGVNYPDGFSPVAQYMAGISTEDMLQKEKPKSDSKRVDIKDAATDADDLRDLLHRLVLRLSDIDDTLEDLVDTVQVLVDNNNAERSEASTVVVKVDGAVNVGDLTEAVINVIESRERLREVRRGRLGPV